MKVRIRFSKSGALVYIGHLDVMRYFQKLFRRADIPVKYSGGFSPHQILSFSNPLPLGMGSKGEYADVELTGVINSTEAVDRLNECSVPEIRILSFRQLPEKCENAMAAVRAARYNIKAGEDHIEDPAGSVDEILAKDDITVLKRTKKSEKYVNIRPLIYELAYDKASSALNMLISSGSSDNLKPELVIEAMLKDRGSAYDMSSFDITRIDQYTLIDDKLVSLGDVGKDIL
ncbi:MAG: TIGR03936 family radical SAM-associated protein [Lachnospiraceae bacterium]|nr:TIGR03936 family radical SAM-associated protein [Lachnospiraceae bacterium]